MCVRHLIGQQLVAILLCPGLVSVETSAVRASLVGIQMTGLSSRSGALSPPGPGLHLTLTHPEISVDISNWLKPAAVLQPWFL